ncbi:MAG TPA: MFS transporter [Actinocrinis sp.]|jgi:EmrB/QacA subfamily drug resistance transporter|uniref:MFS transporter n=1 Tax=Actinocrinis sp. TaxID=1920516 RepID=UPI002DDCB58E|nr:MFS transporter [Actinocrinis sp.]HEV3172009.1 MFS transporter [Actinocrinis sp.]
MSDNTALEDATGAGAHPPDAAAPDPKRWLALTVVLLAQLMVVLDGTIVNIAMPSAQKALHIDDANRQWIVTAYTLAFGGLLLLGGRIADYVGRKRIFLIGLVGFAGASALGGAAQNEAMLFSARALQGAFGAILAPAALSIVTVTFTDVKDRAKAFGVFGAISGVGAAIGLLMGGLLTEYANWRWCLFVNIVVAAIAFAAAIPIVQESKAEGNTRYDIPGTLLSSIGIAALVYGFTEAAKTGWSSTGALVSFSIAAVLLVGFVFLESRLTNPLLPLRVIWHRNRGGSYLTSIILGAGMLGMFLFMTYYFQGTLHWSPLKTGVAYLPFSGALIVIAGVGSALLPRVGPRVMMTFGGLLATGAMAWLTQLRVDSSYAGMILPAFILMAAGMAFVFVPLGNTSLTGVANHDAGVASAVLNTTQQVGGSLGVALLNTVFTTAVASFITAHGPAQAVQGAIHGYNVAFTVSAILIGLSTLVTFTMIRKDSQNSIETEHVDATAGTPAPVHVG